MFRRPHSRSLLLLFAAALCARADDFDALRLRWRDMLLSGDPAIPAVRSRISSIESTARSRWTSMQKAQARGFLWSDIGRTNVSADVSSNYGRLRDMAVAWATPGQPLFQDSALLDDTLAGLDWMDANRYSAASTEYDNWWDWEIGSPAILVDISVILYDRLTPTQLARYMAAVEKFDSNPSVMIVKTVSTGANLADKCKIAILRGVLVKDAAKIAMAVKALSPVFPDITSGDGFYADGSFIQHTRHPYTGSYGLVLLGDVANLLYLLAGSPWEVTDPAAANIARWVTDGFSPLIFRGAMMDLVRGRAISRNSSPDHAIGHGAIASLLRIAQFAPPELAVPTRARVKEWLLDDTSRDYASNLSLDQIADARRLLDDLSVAPAPPPTASRVYASMDRVVHLRPTWALGIAMHSTRIYNYESINNENLKGWHTGDGMTYLHNADLTQFSDTFWPSVDPQRLPGTTVIAGSTARQSQPGGNNAVGGSTLGPFSAAMMYLQPDGGQLTARKAWFLFDNEVVALGADIRSTAAGKPVETIVENRRVPADVVFTQDPKGGWAHLAGQEIGYWFPNGGNWQTLTETRTGAWSAINAGGPATPLTAAYRTIWFDHGAQPTAASYAYVLLPGKSAQQTAAYAAAPKITILQNDAAAQAVTHRQLGIRAVAFWKGGQTVSGITSDKIASVILRQTRGAVDLAIADPTQAADVVHIEIADIPALSVTADDGVTVDSTSPTIRLSVRVKGAAGKTFHARIVQRPTAPRRRR